MHLLSSFPSTKCIRVRHLCKHYIIHLRESDEHATFLGFLRRRPCLVQAVHNLTFDLLPGEMVGFLGPNGAGKTTTLKVLTGLLQPTTGDVSVFGFVPWQRKNSFLRHITFVVGNRSQLWWDLPVADSFEIHRAIYRLRYEDYNTMRTTLTDLLELGPLLRKPVRTLSLGERMKCEFAVALLHRPQILFLDEPTIGLDIPTQRRIRAFLSEYNRQFGATVLLTSHNMTDIEALCQRVLVIGNGELLFDGGLTQLVHSVSSQKIITIKLDSSITHYDDRGILESVLASFIDNNGKSINSILVENTVRVRLPAQLITSFMQQLFAVLPVVDVSIEDIPIEEVIEHIFTNI